MANPINHSRYSAKKLSCDAPMPNVARIPAKIGNPQQLTTPSNARNDDSTPAIVVQIVFDLLILFFLFFNCLF
ncbi:MAG TPA: hypothetical protein DDZ96_14970 [Porphyromonadaceae bacterium]|nr:hypothetical protein [Porphyromonadaceae bacterium]HBX19280.1 hypothetical protein [Porphyromonadaceae bacterium]HCM20445.1 hypothetical protein [Porphyromonadaceae bacterium]